MVCKVYHLFYHIYFIIRHSYYQNMFLIYIHPSVHFFFLVLETTHTHNVMHLWMKMKMKVWFHFDSRFDFSASISSFISVAISNVLVTFILLHHHQHGRAETKKIQQCKYKGSPVLLSHHQQLVCCSHGVPATLDLIWGLKVLVYISRKVNLPKTC